MEANELEFIDVAVRIDVASSKVASEVNAQFKKFVTSKDIENRRQKVQILFAQPENENQY